MDWLWIAAIAALWVATAEAALWLHRAAWPKTQLPLQAQQAQPAREQAQ